MVKLYRSVSWFVDVVVKKKQEPRSRYCVLYMHSQYSAGESR